MNVLHRIRLPTQLSFDQFHERHRESEDLLVSMELRARRVSVDVERDEHVEEMAALPRLHNDPVLAHLHQQFPGWRFNRKSFGSEITRVLA